MRPQHHANPPWPTVPLGSVCELITLWNPTAAPDDPFSYIDLTAVSNRTKKIDGANVIMGSDAPSRARQKVKTDDLLVSTVRPNLNAVALVPAGLDGATASTGFTVLRASELANPRYLFHWVRSQRFVSEMTRRASGASYPAVTDKIVKESMIHLPPLGVQRRIAEVLDAADAVRAARRATLTRLDELPQAIFHQMFAGQDWPTQPLGMIATLSALIHRRS